MNQEREFTEETETDAKKKGKTLRNGFISDVCYYHSELKQVFE